MFKTICILFFCVLKVLKMLVKILNGSTLISDGSCCLLCMLATYLLYVFFWLFGNPPIPISTYTRIRITTLPTNIQSSFSPRFPGTQSQSSLRRRFPRPRTRISHHCLQGQWTQPSTDVHSTHTYLPMKMEQTECSETSAFKIQTPGNNPNKSIQHSEHSKSLKPRTYVFIVSSCIFSIIQHSLCNHVAKST